MEKSKTDVVQKLIKNFQIKNTSKIETLSHLFM